MSLFIFGDDKSIFSLQCQRLDWASELQQQLGPEYFGSWTEICYSYEFARGNWKDKIISRLLLISSNRIDRQNINPFVVRTDDLRKVLSMERISRKQDRSRACLEDGLIKIAKRMGKWSLFGKSKYLLPHEALFLMEIVGFAFVSLESFKIISNITFHAIRID